MTRRPFPFPPATHTSEGGLRRVGVELEMAGIDLDRLAREVAAHVEGQLHREGRYEWQITGDDAGPWQVELDVGFLKERGRQPPEGALEEVAENLVRMGVEQIAPMEVVSPPLPLDRLETVDALVERLRGAGARGTTDGVVYAFGLQLNPEMPAVDAGTVLAYLKAFLCLYDWLTEQSEVDLARRITTYVDPFPKDYVRLVVDPGYAPDLPTLMDDYLTHNPTRNRALDLLPLFAELDPGRLRRHVDDPRVKARPALHYRLPNCEIDRPDWGVGQAWRDWLQVEHLAADRGRLDRLAARYAERLARPLGSLFNGWAEEAARWLVPPEDL